MKVVRRNDKNAKKKTYVHVPILEQDVKIPSIILNAVITEKMSIDSLVQVKGSIYKLSPNKGSCGNGKCDFYCGRCPRDFNDNLICCNISDKRIIFEKTKEMKR